MVTKAAKVKPDYSYLDKVLNVTPDWKQLWTPAEAEQELSIAEQPFVFSGSGWYNYPRDTVLVLPAPSPNGNKFWFWVYNERSPAEAINQLANAPVRVEERK